MLKRRAMTASATAAVLMMLGCVRGPVSPTVAIGDNIDTAKPVSERAGSVSSDVTVLWRDIGIYRASGPLRLAGPIYQVRSYETKAECEAAQQAAMANEALSRVGSTTEQLSDGIKTWDSDRQHYTTFRYVCRLPGARPAPFQ